MQRSSEQDEYQNVEYLNWLSFHIKEISVALLRLMRESVLKNPPYSINLSRPALPETHIKPAYKSSSHRGKGPDFIGIGAQKAGTTWLFENLKRHPDINFPAEKEVHFWDNRERRPVSEWLDLFQTDKLGQQGEITPAYACLDTEVITEIKEFCPKLRLFFSVRNPIERAWSSALMALERAEMTLNDASNLWFIDHFKSAGSLRRGDVEACLARWSSVFPLEQIHVLFFDDLVRYPQETLIRISNHIGVDGDFFRSISEEKLKTPVFVGPGEPLRPELRRYLKIQYGRKISRLQDLLNRDLSHWLCD